MRDIVDIYLETGDFERAVKESGLPTLVAHIKLLGSGVLTMQDKINYSSESGKRGAEAEAMFQEMFPEAVNYNRIVHKNNPIFDFKYGDLTIDIKYSSRLKRKNSEYYIIRVNGGQNLTVAFCERKKGTALENPYILVIPFGFVNVRNTMQIGVGSERFKEFLVSKEELQEIIPMYDEVLRSM